MLPQLGSLQPHRSEKALQHSSKADTEPVSLLGQAAHNGQEGQLEGQLVASDGQHQLVGPVEVCEADVQASLDRVRQRTATTIGAPKVGHLLLLVSSVLLVGTVACSERKECELLSSRIGV